MNQALQKCCSLLCGTALFAIMVLTFFDVGGRKFLERSIPGSLELTELLMVVVIFAGLPLVSQRDEHVVFNSLDATLPAFVRRVQTVIVQLLCAAVMLGLGYLMTRTGYQFWLTGETTAQLKLPKAPFIFGIGLLCAVTGIIHLGQMLAPMKELPEGEGTAL